LKYILTILLFGGALGCSDLPFSDDSEDTEENKNNGNSWKGTERAYEERFEARKESGGSILYDKESDSPVSIPIVLLNDDGNKWIEHHYKDGLEDGIRTVWDENGKVTYKFVYQSGALKQTLVRGGKKVD
jgi:antitoxin component YwqK of YwqJK toxin-antitoxin module